MAGRAAHRPGRAARLLRSGDRPALTLRAAFRLTLRRTEGLIGSVLHLLGLNVRVPDHSTFSGRTETLVVPWPKPGSAPFRLLVDSPGLKLCGLGEWLEGKHGTWRRRARRMLHLTTDADTGEIAANVQTDRDADDGSQAGRLLDQVDAVASFTGNGAHDRDGVHAEVAARHLETAVTVPPRANAMPSASAETAPTGAMHIGGVSQARPDGLAAGVGVQLARPGES